MNLLLSSILVTLISLTQSDIRIDDKATTIVVIQKKIPKNNGRIYENARTYRELIEKSDLFIDKTTLISKLFEFQSIKILLILSNPGWSKTTNLHMVKAFFEVETTEEGAQLIREHAPNYQLFRHNKVVHENGEVEELQDSLLISQHPPFIDLFQGKYPVIFLSFENVSASTYDEFVTQVSSVISDIFKQYKYLNNSELLTDEGNYTSFHNILEGKASAEELTQSIQLLSKFLHWYFDQKPYILVDDYDCIFKSFFTHDVSEEDQQNIRKFYTDLLINSLQTNEFMDRCIMAGIYDVTSLLEGFNESVRINTTETILYNAFSLTAFEIDSMFRTFPSSVELDRKSRQWFNGFRSGRQLTKRLHEFPPYIRVFNNKNVTYYEQPTSADSFIRKSLEVKRFRGMLANIVCGKTYLRKFASFDHAVALDLKKIPLTPDFIVEQEDRGKYLTLLYSSGYLTDRKNYTDVSLQIPNHRIKYKLSEFIMDYYRTKFNILPHLIDNVISSMYNYMVEDSDSAHFAKSLYEFFTQFPLQTDIYPYHLLNYVLNYFALKFTTVYSQFRLLDVHTQIHDATVYIGLYSPEIKVVFGAKTAAMVNERTLITLHRWENYTVYAPIPNRTKIIALGIPLHGDYQLYQSVIYHNL
ncbi:uncharacterized protein LOC135836762 [Planococcus citri]|uniref:uncharacterized protein LOC135836762 n=1 Tax=Planococcus citri TaxID=170843 RepID=UPI0031F9DE20